MEPLTIVLGMIGAAGGAEVLRKKKPYQGEVTSLPGAQAVPGDLGQIPRLRSRGARRSRRRRLLRQQRAQQSRGASTDLQKGVQIYISDRQGGQPNVKIFDGSMTQEQIDQLKSYLRRNSARSRLDYRVVVVLSDRGFLIDTASVQPTAAVNLRRLYTGR